MARMRLVAEAYREILENDPNTALTMCALRRLVNSGAIPAVYSGRKKFINLDVLLEYLDRQGVSERSSETAGNIRPISIR